MISKETKLKGAYWIEVQKKEDERGFFGRAWCRNEFNQYQLKTDFVQHNISFNTRKGTLRGMHYQKEPFQEAKLIRCTKGSIFDVIIDLRQDSPTYKQYSCFVLSQDDHMELYIPEGFAHGFITLEDNSEVMYLMSQYYHPDAAAGIRWNDEQFNIPWPIKPLVISTRDASYPDFD